MNDDNLMIIKEYFNDLHVTKHRLDMLFMKSKFSEFMISEFLRFTYPYAYPKGGGGGLINVWPSTRGGAGGAE